jgi:hypothetical protein
MVIESRATLDDPRRFERYGVLLQTTDGRQSIIAGPVARCITLKRPEAVDSEFVPFDIGFEDAGTDFHGNLRLRLKWERPDSSAPQPSYIKRLGDLGKLRFQVTRAVASMLRLKLTATYDPELSPDTYLLGKDIEPKDEEPDDREVRRTKLGELLTRDPVGTNKTKPSHAFTTQGLVNGSSDTWQFIDLIPAKATKTEYIYAIRLVDPAGNIYPGAYWVGLFCCEKDFGTSQ